MSTCAAGCGRPTERMLCTQCVWEIRRELDRVPDLVAELETALSRQAVMAESAGRIDGQGETPLAYGTLAAQARDELRLCLVGWVRDLARDDPRLYPRDELDAMARWLTSRADEIAIHEAAKEIHDEITRRCREAWHAVDRAANRTRFPVGPCPDTPCEGQVDAYIPTSSERPARLECDQCGTRWETHQWLRAGRRILARMRGSLPRRSAA